MTADEKAKLVRKLCEQPKPPVGSLCVLAPWCDGAGRLVHVTQHFPWARREVEIQFLDEEGIHKPPQRCMVGNLEVLSDS